MPNRSSAERARARPGAAPRTPEPPFVPPDAPTAVLVDGSALYLTVRSQHEGRTLNYRGLVEVLCRAVGGLAPSWARGPEDHWVMWTPAAPQNQGQARFLEFAARDLGWEVRRYAPGDGYTVDPAVLNIAGDGRLASRLVRFDAAIAFAMGRFAATHRVVAVSDSFTLAEPLLRVAAVKGLEGGGGNFVPSNYVAFFGRALDARWWRVLRNGRSAAANLIDLDDHEVALFGDRGPASPDPEEETGFVF